MTLSKEAEIEIRKNQIKVYQERIICCQNQIKVIEQRIKEIEGKIEGRITGTGI